MGRAPNVGAGALYQEQTAAQIKFTRSDTKWLTSARQAARKRARPILGRPPRL